MVLLLPWVGHAQTVDPVEGGPSSEPIVSNEDVENVRRATPGLLRGIGARENVAVRLIAKTDGEYLLEFQNDWLSMKRRLPAAAIERGESGNRDDKLERFARSKLASRSDIEKVLAATGHTLDDVTGPRRPLRELPRSVRWDPSTSRFLLVLTSAGEQGETCTRVIIDPGSAKIVMSIPVPCRVE
ncbi:MAG: hypothetical protein WA208_17760 [Thermoanaerobaculia bacterium]